MTTAGAAGERGTVLLALARAALIEAFGAEPQPPPEAAWLDVPGATFVTLKIDGELRAASARSRPTGRWPRTCAATRWRRRFVIRASRGSRPPSWRESGCRFRCCPSSNRWPVVDEADLLARLRPGVDGLVLEHDGHRGTFLPAVWRQLPRPEEFLRQLKRKAGLPPEFWAPGVRISRYTVDSWAEAAA